MSRKSSFAPVVSADTRVLILGSLPGERSLAAGRYYAHPQNRFWQLVGDAIGRDLVSLDYPDQLDALIAARIGLWDVVASAERSGSLDSAIRNAQHNALSDLVATLPDLRAIAFNGRKAESIGRPLLANITAELIALPSSSPAYAALPLAAKQRQWGKLCEFLA
ncbi:DNA-deoxyinosine glycosylase [Altererythrobacter xixiisoli]|uniref:DNA-deoxyinosine glycosylase n=2 Tax=Croceibacterium xixiisoli TaxID=1476466 RepID=A0A6I4TSW7_9SPHN|nr:DNA-deoxyinosine glycosylase [Croceibacterium xixiisoli]